MNSQENFFIFNKHVSKTKDVELTAALALKKVILSGYYCMFK